MILSILSLALLTLFSGIALWGGVLAWRERGKLRVLGIAMLLQGLLFAALQVALSTLPLLGLEPSIPVEIGELLGNVLSTLGVVGGIGVLLFLLARRFARLVNEPRPGIHIAGLAVGIPLLGIGGIGGLFYLSTPDRVRERDPLKREISVPEGFQATVYLNRQIDNPTSLSFGSEGELIVGDIAGSIWIARDRDNDGNAEELTEFANGFSFLTGVLWHEGEVFVASQGKVEALKDSDGDGVHDQRRTLVDGLPSMQYIPHTNNALALGPDGRIYFGVGSTTDGEVEQNPLAAAIVGVNPDGSNLEVFARGLSNSFDVAFNQTGDMFAADNQPRVAGSTSDELNFIIEGGHYGYPYYFGEPPKEDSTIPPVLNFPPHSSPNGLTFYGAQQFPPEYTDNMFIALWSLGEVYRVELARSPGGAYLSRTSEFAKGFVYPLDVVVGPDGSLYVADFGTSAIYKISYIGE